jgi:hypothetical protein
LFTTLSTWRPLAAGRVVALNWRKADRLGAQKARADKGLTRDGDEWRAASALGGANSWIDRGDINFRIRTRS